MWHFDYANFDSATIAIARLIKAKISVVRYLLTQGNGEMNLNGKNVRLFSTENGLYYFAIEG